VKLIHFLCPCVYPLAGNSTNETHKENKRIVGHPVFVPGYFSAGIHFNEMHESRGTRSKD
jgi:hypothetical protein